MIIYKQWCLAYYYTPNTSVIIQGLFIHTQGRYNIRAPYPVPHSKEEFFVFYCIVHTYPHFYPSYFIVHTYLYFYPSYFIVHTCLYFYPSYLIVHTCLYFYPSYFIVHTCLYYYPKLCYIINRTLTQPPVITNLS